ncbi:MAG TPA: hypothetical protein VF618_19630 [Thermoanaerobaculia bacterium]
MRPFEVHSVEQAYVRRGLFGIELLDAVTLERVSRGVTVVAEGLQGEPSTNTSGVFVWLREDLTRLRKVTIDPGVLPYEVVELEPAQIQLPVTRVELPPRLDYPFAAGITGMRGTLIEERVVPPVPVRDAEVYLRWFDENAVWRDAPTVAGTDTRGANFTAILRLSPSDVPQLDAKDAVTVRLRARRGNVERESGDLKLPQGRIADPSFFAQGPDALVFAWDELQP